MKKMYIFLLVIFGFSLNPALAIACGKHKQACKKEAAAESTNDSCCSKHSSDNERGCSGACGQKSCGCAALAAGNLSYLLNSERHEIAFDNFSSKQKFYNAETNLSSGYNFIWLIPKIS